MAALTVGVVLVNYRSLTDVAARLDSGVLAGTRVVVVDNASDPHGVQALCDRTGASAVLLDRNVGFAGGVAAGTAALGPVEELLLLNPDAALDAAALAALQAALRERSLDGVAPLLVEPGGRLQVGAAGGPVTLRSVAWYFLGIAHLLPGLRGIFLTRRQSRSASGVDWLCAACLLLRGDVLDRFGALPLDELVYAEDLAWGTAATARGARLALVPSVRVQHAVGASGGSAAWVGAVERLLKRRLGRPRGYVAVGMVRFGLVTRRMVRGDYGRWVAARR